jgi:predicted polyphosphate/ATP-dependent NAD kinase
MVNKLKNIKNTLFINIFKLIFDIINEKNRILNNEDSQVNINKIINNIIYYFNCKKESYINIKY